MGKTYHRKFGEEIETEDTHMSQLMKEKFTKLQYVDPKSIMFRKKEVHHLEKHLKHLFMFSKLFANLTLALRMALMMLGFIGNVDSSQYIELNNNQHAKAWAVLYNFRNKSLDSPLFDEVDNIQVSFEMVKVCRQGTSIIRELVIRSTRLLLHQCLTLP